MLPMTPVKRLVLMQASVAALTHVSGVVRCLQSGVRWCVILTTAPGSNIVLIKSETVKQLTRRMKQLWSLLTVLILTIMLMMRMTLQSMTRDVRSTVFTSSSPVLISCLQNCTDNSCW